MEPAELAIFNRIRNHLLTQGRKAEFTPSGNCGYRAPADTPGVMLKCGVGAVISDESYTPYMEGQSMSAVGAVDGRWVQVGKMEGDHLAEALNMSGVPASARMQSLLLFSQHVHDSPADPSEWGKLFTLENALEVMDGLVESAKRVAQALYNESHIPIATSLPPLTAAVQEDGWPISEEIADRLVSSEQDSSEEIWLSERFPATYAAIAQFY